MKYNNHYTQKYVFGKKDVPRYNVRMNSAKEETLVSQTSSQQSSRRVYLDYAASTPIDQRVHAAMEPYWMMQYGNAGAIHKEGMTAKQALEDSRSTIARHLGAHPDEIIFTSGGTESNNLAVFGALKAARRERGTLTGLHAITSLIEHSSVLEVMRDLEKDGLAVTFTGVD